MSLKLSYSYVDDMLVRMAHHSTVIEGNALTEYETKCILLDGIIPRAMREREFYEVKNYKKYMGFLNSRLQQGIAPIIIRKSDRQLYMNLLSELDIKGQTELGIRLSNEE